MFGHSFIIQPVSWLGEGRIELNMVDEALAFCTRWVISPSEGAGRVLCMQEIRVRGLAEIMHNKFVVSEFSGNAFQIELENQALGKVTGIGFMTDMLVTWEFHVPELNFSGFEFYERQPDDTYLMRAEYTSNDQFRTQIYGKIWRSVPVQG